LLDPPQSFLGHVGDAGLALPDALDQVMDGGGGRGGGETDGRISYRLPKWGWGLKSGGRVEGHCEGQEKQEEQLPWMK
jgi:hypothetical protein